MLQQSRQYEKHYHKDFAASKKVDQILLTKSFPCVFIFKKVYFKILSMYYILHWKQKVKLNILRAKCKRWKEKL